MSVVNAFIARTIKWFLKGYLVAILLDSTIVAYGILYFISDQGRPKRWVVTN